MDKIVTGVWWLCGLVGGSFAIVIAMVALGLMPDASVVGLR